MKINPEFFFSNLRYDMVLLRKKKKSMFFTILREIFYLLRELTFTFKICVISLIISPHQK
jgi:hypothetical protein